MQEERAERQHDQASLRTERLKRETRDQQLIDMYHQVELLRIASGVGLRVGLGVALGLYRC